MTGNLVSNRLGPRHALAGIQAGVLGALWMLAWLMAASLWKHRSVWIVPNLFATTFYGPAVYRNQWLHASWSGVALIFAVYGTGGMIWGVLWRDERRPFAPLYGAITGLLVYYAFFNLIWKTVNPLLPLYSPDRQMQFAHLLWGWTLARSSVYSGRIANAMAEPLQASEAAVRSGEVIR